LLFGQSEIGGYSSIIISMANMYFLILMIMEIGGYSSIIISIRKYMLAILLNYKMRFRGRKVSKLYFAV